MQQVFLLWCLDWAMNFCTTNGLEVAMLFGSQWLADEPYMPGGVEEHRTFLKAIAPMRSRVPRRILPRILGSNFRTVSLHMDEQNY